MRSRSPLQARHTNRLGHPDFDLGIHDESRCVAQPALYALRISAVASDWRIGSRAGVEGNRSAVEQSP